MRETAAAQLNAMCSMPRLKSAAVSPSCAISEKIMLKQPAACATTVLSRPGILMI